MVRPVSEIPTEREAQVMDVLWRLGHATAKSAGQGSRIHLSIGRAVATRDF